MEMVTFFQLAGAFSLAFWGYKMSKFFKQILSESLWSKTVDFRKYGEWVVITGGSDGIGKALAFEFARNGMNIFILARTPSKLKNVKQQIESEFSVSMKTLAVDFSAPDLEYDTIREELTDLDIAVLVNNVAMASIDPHPLLDIPDYETYSSKVINVNMKSMLELSEMILPQMVAKRRGIIVNVSSVIGSRPSPLFAIYGSTKSAMITLTQALKEEYKNDGVIFQCIAPAVTATPMIAERTKPSFMIPTPEKYGKYAIKAIGKSTYTNTSFFWHNLFQLILWTIPDKLFFKAMRSSAEEAILHTNKES